MLFIDTYTKLHKPHGFLLKKVLRILLKKGLLLVYHEPMRIFIVFLLLFSLLSCGRGSDVQPKQKAGETEIADINYTKELDEIKKSLKGEIRIKLKKDSKGYSWEITGKDTQEILRANEMLRKRLNE
jgi:hypothetical protein